MPDDHSEVVPLLPIPNRTVKRLSADDSAGSRVKVGHRQAITARDAQSEMTGRFLLSVSFVGCQPLAIDNVACSRQQSPIGWRGQPV